MPANEPLSLLEPVDLPLRDDDLFYIVQSGLTSTSTASRQLTFFDFIGEISTAVTGAEIQLNGVPISDQSLLNLINTASVTWANAAGGEVRATASGSGGGGLTLVEAKTITSNSTTVTFSGLDGNTDGRYRLMARIKNSSGATTWYYWQPNGLTTNLSSRFAAVDGGGNNDNTATGLQISTAQSGGNIQSNWYIDFSIDIQAKANPDSEAFIRTYQGTMSLLAPGVGQGLGVIGGMWNEGSTNLTSIVVAADDANGIGKGSQLYLYKYAQ